MLGRPGRRMRAAAATARWTGRCWGRGGGAGTGKNSSPESLGMKIDSHTFRLLLAGQRRIGGAGRGKNPISEKTLLLAVWGGGGICSPLHGAGKKNCGQDKALGRGDHLSRQASAQPMGWGVWGGHQTAGGARGGKNGSAQAGGGPWGGQGSVGNRDRQGRSGKSRLDENRAGYSGGCGQRRMGWQRVSSRLRVSGRVSRPASRQERACGGYMSRCVCVGGKS